jgi:hypothetical protein
VSGLWKTTRRIWGAAETSHAKERRREIGHNRSPYYGVAAQQTLGDKPGAKDMIRYAESQGAVREGKGKKRRYVLPSGSQQLLGG